MAVTAAFGEVGLKLGFGDTELAEAILFGAVCLCHEMLGYSL